jgi:hypothetical protein
VGPERQRQRVRPRGEQRHAVRRRGLHGHRRSDAEQPRRARHHDRAGDGVGPQREQGRGGSRGEQRHRVRGRGTSRASAGRRGITSRRWTRRPGRRPRGTRTRTKPFRLLL